MISVEVDSRIRVPKSVLDKGRIRDLCAPFEHSNPQHHKLKRMGYAAYKEPRVIETWDETDSEVSVPRGGMRRLREVVHSWGEKVRVVDRRTLGDRTVGVPPMHDLPLYDYQARCVEAALLAEQGIIRAPTGSGKTSFCLALASRVGVPTIVVVNSNALLKQWVDRVRSEMGSEPGIIQGQRRQIAPLTVAMQQTLNGADQRTWKEINRVFGAVIADECFEGSTPILMADGTLKRIDEVEAGDVLAVGGEVKATMVRWYEGPMVKVGASLCTPDHPVAASGVWKRAASINCADLLLIDPIHEQRHHLRGLRLQNEGALPPGSMQAPFVRGLRGRRDVSSVWSKSAVTEQGRAFAIEVRNGSTLEQGAQDGGLLESRVDGGDRPSIEECRGCNAPPLSGFEISAEGFKIPERGSADQVLEAVGGRGFEETYAKDDRGGQDRSVRREGSRQRGGPDGLRVGDGAPPGRVRDSTCGSDERSSGGAEPLQDRLRSCGVEGCGRDRRLEPSRLCEEEGRPSKGRGSIEPWMARAALPGSVRLRSSSSGVRVSRVEAACRVYNLETEHGVYVAGGVLVHNCHLFSAATFLRTIDRFRARYRIGASADETRRDGKQFLLYDTFGDVLQKVSQEDLIDREFVLDVAVQLEPTEFDWPFYRAHSDAFRIAADGTAVEVAARDAAGRCGVDAEALEAAVRGGPPDFGALMERICADEARNKQVVEIVEDEVFAGSRVLVISHRVEHCRQLAAEFVKRRIPCGLMLGGKDYEQEFASTKARLRSGDARVGVGTIQAVGTGIDVPELDRAVMATPVMSRQLWGQVRGRVCRTAPGKREARIFYLWDREVWGETTLAKMQSWNRVCVVRDGAALIGSREYRRRS